MNRFLRAVEQRLVREREVRMAEVRGSTLPRYAAEMQRAGMDARTERLRDERRALEAEAAARAHAMAATTGLPYSTLLAECRRAIRSEREMERGEAHARRVAESEELARLLGRGLTWREAADVLGVEMSELEARWRWARRHGLVEPGKRTA